MKVHCTKIQKKNNRNEHEREKLEISKYKNKKKIIKIEIIPLDRKRQKTTVNMHRNNCPNSLDLEQ